MLLCGGGDVGTKKPDGAFRPDHRDELTKAFRNRNCRPLQILQSPVDPEDVIDKLERIAISIRKGRYDPIHPPPEVVARIRAFSAQQGWPDPFKRSRGKPVDLRQVWIAR